MKKLALILAFLLSAYSLVFAWETISNRNDRRQSDEYQARQEAGQYQINQEAPGIND